MRRIQHDGLRRQNGFARIRIALGNFRSDFNQAAIFQFANGGGSRFGKFEQFGQQNFAPFFDDVPNVLLAFRQFRKFTAQRQRADEQLFFPAFLFLAHGFGQNAFQRGLRRAAIIFANPAREFQNFRRHQSLRADDFENGFEFGVRRFLGERGDTSENFPRAERHLHAAADFDLPGQFRRNRDNQIPCAARFRD